MKVEAHEVQEIESGVYVFPDEDKFKYSWAIFMWPDGSAGVYTERNSKTGALLGKPIHLPAPERKTKMCTDSACPLMNFNEHEFGKGCRLFKE